MTIYLQYLTRLFMLVVVAALTFSVGISSSNSVLAHDDDVSVSASVAVSDDENNSDPKNARDRREELRERFEHRFEDGTRIRQELRTRIEDGREELRLRIENRQDDFAEHREELRARIEEKQEATALRREELRTRLETRGEDFRAEIQSHLRDRVSDFGDRVIARYRAAIERMDNIALRIASRIEKLEERGFDLSEASALLVDAEAKIDVAVVAVNDAEVALVDLLSADTSATSSVAIFFDARELLSAAKEAIREAHAALVDTIVAIRTNVPEDALDDDSDSDDTDDSDEDTAVDEFEGTVTAATLTSVTLSNGTTVTISGDTVIDAEGDLTTLTAVIDALANGRTVRAEGNLSGNTATSITFEIDE